MPRAATRVASTSFAVASSSRPRGSSLDVLPLVNNSSAHGMFPSPRPSKLYTSSSSSAKMRSSSSSSSPSHRQSIHTADPPRTPTKATAATSAKRKRVLEEKDENDVPRARTVKMPERLINTYLANYDLEAENRIRTANQALQVSIESARAQMISGISAFPRNILSMRLQDYLFPPAESSESNKDKKRISVPTAKANKTPRAAKPGEIVYSARGSPIYLKAVKSGNVATQVSSEDDEDEGGEEPFFDTASDNKSESSESFSLPDEAAYTAQVMEQERNRIMSSEGYLPRSSSMFHRTSSST